jgi:hypothetical protein
VKPLMTLHDNFVKSRRLGKKEAVIFPSQFHKIASIAKEYESQEAIETSGPLYVSDDDLRHELLCRINVPTHDCLSCEVGTTSANITMLVRFDFVPAEQTPVARRCSDRMLPNTSYRI